MECKNQFEHKANTNSTNKTSKELHLLQLNIEDEYFNMLTEENKQYILSLNEDRHKYNRQVEKEREEYNEYKQTDKYKKNLERAKKAKRAELKNNEIIFNYIIPEDKQIALLSFDGGKTLLDITDNNVYSDIQSKMRKSITWITILKQMIRDNKALIKVINLKLSKVAKENIEEGKQIKNNNKNLIITRNAILAKELANNGIDIEYNTSGSIYNRMLVLQTYLYYSNKNLIIEIDKNGKPIGKTLEYRQEEIKEMKDKQREIAKKEKWEFNEKDTGYLSEEEIEIRRKADEEQLERWKKIIGVEGFNAQSKAREENIEDMIKKMSEQLLPENEGKKLKVKRKWDKTAHKLYNYYYYEEPDIEEKLIDIKKRRAENLRKMEEELRRKKREADNDWFNSNVDDDE